MNRLSNSMKLDPLFTRGKIADAKTREKFDRLMELIEGSGSALIAFSGGVDSTLLAALARATLKKRAVAAIGRSASLPESELNEARAIAETIGIELLIVQTREFDDRSYRANDSERCYHCKTALFDQLREIADKRGLAEIFDGANHDDLADHRPGSRAARERGVLSPLRDARIGKDEIRKLAGILDLPNKDKPAAACLASRVAYGDPIEVATLKRIELAENFLKSDLGFKIVRVRAHGGGAIARIEIGVDQIARLAQSPTRSLISARLKEIGFTFVALDLDGYQIGSLNRLHQGERNSP